MAAVNTLEPLPLRHWLRGYGRKALKSDLKAGVTVSLLDLPQSMAYAAVAGLPLQFGTMCSAVSGIAGALFGSSRYIVLGPTNATAFMVFSYFAANPHLDQLAMMPLLVFMIGALLLFGAFLRLAELAQYISRTVVVAYVTGAALLIMLNQLPNMLGVNLTVSLADGTTFQPRTLPGISWQLLQSLSEVQWPNLAVAALTALLYIGVRRWRPAWPSLALALIGAAFAAHGLAVAGYPVATYANARFGVMDLLPPFPDFVSPRFFSDLGHLFGLAVAVAFLATLETVSMAKTLASVSGQRVDSNQDMFSLGLANLSCSYFSGMPCSGSMVRSTLNHQSGARTPFAALFNGVFCLIGALTLGHLVGYIPRAALAVLIFCVALSLINRRNVLVCLTATGSDALVFLITLVATLIVPLHVAIFTGVGASIMLYLRKASRPSLVEYEFDPAGNLTEAAPSSVRQNPAVSIVHVEGELFFGAADLFRTQVQQTCSDPNLRIIILRLKNARHMDATSVMALEELVRLLRRDGRDLIISGLSKDVYRVLRDSGLIDVIGKDNLFLTSANNPNVATRNALKRAQVILGTRDADVKIFIDPAKHKERGT
jgi:SulP family sulfate permease